MESARNLTWDFYRAVKDKSCCLICGNTKTQMHHVSPAEKVSEIGKIAQTGNMGLLRHEFSKVVPLCDACHRAVHKGKIAGWMNGVTNYGKLSNDRVARRYMPFLEYIGEPDLNGV